MPKKQIYDRVGTTTTRVVDHLAVLVKQANFGKNNSKVNYSKDKTSFTYGKGPNGDTLITVDAKKRGRIIWIQISTLLPSLKFPVKTCSPFLAKREPSPCFLLFLQSPS